MYWSGGEAGGLFALSQRASTRKGRAFFDSRQIICIFLFFALEMASVVVAKSIEKIENQVINATDLTPTDLKTSNDARATKYSYYYIGRKLLYVPLFFIMYWACYVLWLVMRTILRRHTLLPQHWDPPLDSEDESDDDDDDDDKNKRRRIFKLNKKVKHDINQFKRKLEIDYL